jgi:DNA-binding MarR family transcriptional regulator
LNTDDRRRVHVRLTQAGHQALESTIDKEEHGEGATIAVLTEQEKQTLAHLLRKLTTATEQ